MDFTKTIVLMIMLLFLAGCASVESPSGAAVQEGSAASASESGFVVAIAAEGDTPNSRVSQGLGKTAYFLIFEDGEFLKAVENTAASGQCGERIAVLTENNVDTIICSKFGDTIKEYLDQAGIEMIKADRKDKAVDALKNAEP